MNKDNIQIAGVRNEKESEQLKGFMKYCMDRTCNTGYTECLECFACEIRWQREQISLQADRIKKLDEDWKELDSDCMILHDKNKQLKKENKLLRKKNINLIEKINELNYKLGLKNI
jgi:hypothetical protein